MEDTVEWRLAQLEKAVENANSKLDNVILQLASRKECPSPGSCLDLRAVSERLVSRVTKLEQWQAGVIAVISVALPLLTIFGPWISRKLLGP